MSTLGITAGTEREYMVEDEPMWTCHYLFGVFSSSDSRPIDDLLTDAWYDDPRRDDVNECTWLALAAWAEERVGTVARLEMPWADLPKGISGWENFSRYGQGPLTPEFSHAVAKAQPTALELWDSSPRIIFEQTNTWDDQRIFCAAAEANVVRERLRISYNRLGLQPSW